MEDIDQSRPEAHASAEKGEALIGPAIEGNVQLLTRMILGEEFEQPPRLGAAMVVTAVAPAPSAPAPSAPASSDSNSAIEE